MELVGETERLLTLYDTVPTTNEIIPSSTWVHWDHHVVLLYLQLCRGTGDSSAASGPAAETEAEATRSEQRSVMILGVCDMSVILLQRTQGFPSLPLREATGLVSPLLSWTDCQCPLRRGRE